jgi:hypothetical protein
MKKTPYSELLRFGKDLLSLTPSSSEASAIVVLTAKTTAIDDDDDTQKGI